MQIYRTADFKTVTSFLDGQSQLAIVARNTPLEAAHFFQGLKQVPFDVSGKIRQENAEDDIRQLLESIVSEDLQAQRFYQQWISDMAQVCKHFCALYGSNAVGYWLGSKRGCRRYHVDNVKMRALVTYAGQGTEYIPDEAADRYAFRAGEPNQKILKDPSAVRYINTWDVAIFRGGPQGLLHRTPDSALKGSSILMRLDDPAFWHS